MLKYSFKIIFIEQQKHIYIYKVQQFKTHQLQRILKSLIHSLEYEVSAFHFVIAVLLMLHFYFISRKVHVNFQSLQ